MTLIFQGQLILPNLNSKEINKKENNNNNTERKSLFKSTSINKKNNKNIPNNVNNIFPIFKLPPVDGKEIKKKIPTDDAVLCEIKKKKAEESMNVFFYNYLIVTNT